jgi:tripartite-type tricarboxylate transporter receptor subunit TctC
MKNSAGTSRSSRLPGLNRWRQLQAVALGAVACFWGTVATAAEPFPTKPIIEIVPFSAGGPTDVIARVTGEHMSKVLGRQIVIENVAGAGGTTGITRGAQAKADGYTIMMGHMGTHAAAPALYPRLKYNPEKDFEPIGLAVGTPILIVARKDFPAKDFKEFVAYLKANQGKVNEAHAGVGSVSFTSCTLFDSQLGIKPARVAYRGTGPALNDLMGGQVDYMCDQIVNLAEQIKGGRIKAYAIATEKRSPALPAVPTTAEGGMPQFQVSAWNALFAPKGTPKDVVAKLNDALAKALDDGATRQRLLDLGGILPDGSERTPGALGDLVKKEVARWTPILKATGALGE